MQKPNIMLVVFDSLSARDLNQHLDDLPTLRALLEQSHTFTNSYTCSPESSPARASLFTGLDVGVHGLWTDGVALAKRETTQAEVFAAQGYQTWLVGRRHLAGVSNWTTEHARRGEYHYFDWAHGPLHRSRQNAYLAWLQTQAPETFSAIFPKQANPDDTEISDEQRDAMQALPNAQSFNHWVGQQVVERIDDTPFFGIAGFVVGQTMGATGALVEADDARALRQADGALAAIKQVMPKDTIFVITAGRGSIRDANTDAYLQEDAVKVPLMIWSAEGTAKTVQETVSTMDIAPTLYELAGVHLPQRVQGKSLLSATPRNWALSRLRHPDCPHQTALRADEWKLIVTHGAPAATHLYNLKEDPSEAHNLAEAPKHQDQLEAMLDLMIDTRVTLEDRLEPRIAAF